MTSFAALADWRQTQTRRRARNAIFVAAFALIGAAFVDALFSNAHAATPVELKQSIQASGPALTLNDLFTGAGDVGARAVAPAPKPGTNSVVSTRFLVAAASAAGLSWSPPSGVDTITISDEGAVTAAARPINVASIKPAAGPGVAGAIIRRGDLVTLVYVAPGLQLTTRAKALSDGVLGQPVQLINLQSNRTVDAVVTGPGAASANPGAAFQ